jgi:hypothetical protein
MNNKFRLIKKTDNGEFEKEYKTLKEISDDLNVEIHIIRKINKLTEIVLSPIIVIKNYMKN